MRASTHKTALRGFSLVEFMVAIALGLVVLAVIVALYSGTTRSSAALTNASQEVQNGSYAVRFLADDLRHAGYYGGASSPLASVLAALPDPCETSDMVALRAALALPVQGYDAPATAPIACIPASDFVPGTDVLVVRRASTVVTPSGSLSAHDLYIQNNNDWTDANNPALNVGLAANFPLLNKDGATPADIRKYYVRVYYVSPCHLYATGASACGPAADGGRPVPTLKMLELAIGSGGGAVTMNSIALAEGVENFQVDYGVDTSGQGAAQTFVTRPAALADWSNVTEIKLNLLVRNPQATPGYVDAKTYSLGLAAPVTPGGPFKRHLFAEHVRLTNVGEMREAP
jgi:type IV pilus assembly protein PilW